MPTTSAGLLPYRRLPGGGIEVLLGHMGGPFWARKDEGAWTLLKGELDPDEDPHAAALREASEELGMALPPSSAPDIGLGEVRQRAGKKVLAWAREWPQPGPDLEQINSNTVEIEWPPRSGRRIEVPEIDRVAWLAPDEARRLAVSAQAAFVDRLEEALATERVVLLDEHRMPIGSELKQLVHSAKTPLHLAFSCHVLNAAGEVLVSRRALGKRTWPGVWTNSFCGHPQPGEAIEDAVVRRGRDELGLSVREVRVVLPGFRYRATDASGIVENEVCPVYLAVADEEPHLNPDEVMDARWADAGTLGSALRATPWAFSPWFVSQAQEMPLYAPPGPRADR